MTVMSTDITPSCSGIGVRRRSQASPCRLTPWASPMRVAFVVNGEECG
jgi:hypothetical protein